MYVLCCGFDSMFAWWDPLNNTEEVLEDAVIAREDGRTAGGLEGCARIGGGAGWCPDQEKRMSIISATAPQRGVNHTQAASGPSFQSHALLIYSSQPPLSISPSLPRTPSLLEHFSPPSFFFFENVQHTSWHPFLFTLCSLSISLSRALCAWKIHVVFERIHTYTHTHAKQAHSPALSA